MRPWQPKFPKLGGRPRFNVSSSSAGRAEDLGGKYFRSLWERNYARWLQLRKERGEIKDWQYEPRIFWFETIRRGTTNYRPDFRVDELDGSHWWAEVKGWMSRQDMTKLKRMKKYFPAERIVVIDGAWFKGNRHLALIVPFWERGEKRGPVAELGVSYSNDIVKQVMLSRATSTKRQ
jgi:hypothetical protein